MPTAAERLLLIAETSAKGEEIATGDRVFLRALAGFLNSFKEIGLFYTPTDPQEITRWIEKLPKGEMQIAAWTPYCMLVNWVKFRSRQLGEIYGESNINDLDDEIPF